MILAAAFVLHVASGALWTGATLYFVYATLPRGLDGSLDIETFVDGVHRLLMITRWTGVVLPLTGAYMIWVLYTPLELLTATTRGWLVLGMLTLWGVMNGLIELGVLRIRRAVDPGVGWATYMQEGVPTDVIEDATVEELADATVEELATRARPALLASAGCAVLLLVNAGLLAGGVA